MSAKDLLATAALSLIAVFPALAQSPVPVAKEPGIISNSKTNSCESFDVMVPPGDATLFHVHSNDYAFVSIGDATLKAQVLGGQPADLIVKNAKSGSPRGRSLIASPTSRTLSFVTSRLRY